MNKDTKNYGRIFVGNLNDRITNDMIKNEFDKFDISYLYFERAKENFGFVIYNKDDEKNKDIYNKISNGKWNTGNTEGCEIFIKGYKVRLEGSMFCERCKRFGHREEFCKTYSSRYISLVEEDRKEREREKSPKRRSPSRKRERSPKRRSRSRSPIERGFALTYSNLAQKTFSSYSFDPHMTSSSSSSISSYNSSRSKNEPDNSLYFKKEKREFCEHFNHVFKHKINMYGEIFFTALLDSKFLLHLEGWYNNNIYIIESQLNIPIHKVVLNFNDRMSITISLLNMYSLCNATYYKLRDNL